MVLPVRVGLLLSSLCLLAGLVPACGGSSNNPDIVSIAVTPADSTIHVDDTVTLTATARDQNDAVVSGVTFSWNSSDSSVAAVDSGGGVTGIASGQASITASAGGVSGSAAVEVVPQVDQYTLQLTFSGNGGGTVTSSPAGLACSGDCSAQFAAGTAVSLTAVPTGGSSFAGFAGDCSGTSCTVTMDGARAVTVTFNAGGDQYPLFVSRNGNGTVTSAPGGIDCGADCSEMYSAGTQVVLQAAPDTDWSFDGWGGDCAGTGDCSLTLDAARTVTANFVPVGTRRTLTVSVSGDGQVTSMPPGISCGGGENTCSATFDDGTAVTLSANPAGGQIFSGWSGACTGSDTCFVTMNADLSIGAAFEPQSTSYTLTVAVTGDGTVTSDPAGIDCGPSCTASFAAASTVTLSAAPGSGQRFAGWSGACSGTGDCTLDMTGDQWVSATFEPIPVQYTVTVTIGGGGGGTVTSSPAGIDCGATCSADFDAGSTVTLSANPDSEYRLVQWTGDCSGSGGCDLSMDGSKSVGAEFAPVQYNLALSVYGSGTITATPPGSDCSDNCNLLYDSGTQVTLTASADPGWLFGTGWGGDCTGTGDCSLTMSAGHQAWAVFDGPFEFNVSHAVPNCAFSLIPGESRSLPVTVSVTHGNGLPVDLTMTGLPPGVSASFEPPSVTPDGTSVLTLTAEATAQLGSTAATITGQHDTQVHNAGLQVEVRSPYWLANPTGLVVEAGGATALVAENMGWCDRLVRVDTATKAVLHTITSDLMNPGEIALESGGGTALVADATGLLRVDLATGTVTAMTTELHTPWGLALLDDDNALVTDCGVTSCDTTGRLVMVDLPTGHITAITSPSMALKTPRGIAIEASGNTALVIEQETWNGRLLRINLTTGAVIALSSGMVGPMGVALEPGGQDALVGGTGWNGPFLSRIHLASGTQTPILQYGCCSPNPTAIAIEAGGTALFTDRSTQGRLMRVAYERPYQVVAPGRQSAESLFSPWGVAVEAGGTTALVTDCGPTDCASTGRLSRVDLALGLITPLVNNLSSPRGVAIETGGTSALVVETGTWTGRLLRVDLSDNSVTSLVDLPTGLTGIAIEAGGTTALLAGPGWNGPLVARADLAAGSLTTLFSVDCCHPAFSDIALEPGGASALVVDQAAPGALYRVDLSSNTFAAISHGFNNPIGVRAEDDGLSALVVENGDNYSTGRVIRVDLATGSHQVVVSGIGAPIGLGLAPGAPAPFLLVTGDNRLTRVEVATPWVRPDSLVEALQSAGPMALGPGGNALLYSDCGPTHLGQYDVPEAPNCKTEARLRRVELATRAVSDVLAGVNQITGLAMEAGGTSLLATDCGPTGTDTCGSAGRLVRITLGGAVSLLTGNLNIPVWVSIEPGGTSALVVEGGAGRLLWVDLADGSWVPLASGFQNPRQVVRETGGAGDTALLADDYGIHRVDLSDGTSTRVVSWPTERFLVEPGGATALLLMRNSWPPPALVRADLTSGGLDLLSPGLLNYGASLLYDASESTVFFTESLTGSGAIWALPTP